MGIFDYQSGNSQGILIHVLGMNPAGLTLIKYTSFNRTFRLDLTSARSNKSGAKTNCGCSEFAKDKYHFTLMFVQIYC